MKTARMGKNGLKGGFATGVGFAVALVVAGVVLKPFKGSGMGQRFGRGPARVRGRIRGASIMGVRMGNNVSKDPGQILTAAVTFDNATVDFNDDVIAWPFRITVSSGAFKNGFGELVINPASAGVSQTKNVVATVKPDAIPGDYTVKVTLEAQTSNPDGTPSGTWSNAGLQPNTDTSGTLTVNQLTGAAVPGGGIGNVVLSNRQRMGQRWGRR